MYSKKWLEELPLLLLLLILALLLHLLPGFISVCRAQHSTPPGQALGQPVPGNISLRLINAERHMARIADYRGKLLLLDFYATWCSSSRAPLPRLDSLQQQFGDSLQILLVSYRGSRDTEASVKTFFQEWRTPAGARLRLPSTLNDTTLIKLFPHRRIPHFAWIAPDGTLGAVTSAAAVTASNIRRALTKGIMPPSKKQDVDLSQPLLLSGAVLPEAGKPHYSLLAQGKLDDGPSRVLLRRDGEKINGIVLANMPLLNLYKLAKRQLYPELGDTRFEVEGVDSALLYQEKSGLTAEEWKTRHTYTYELHLQQAGNTSLLYQALLQDLNRYSGYQGILEMRQADCLLLRRKGRRSKLGSKGGPPENSLFRQHQPTMQQMPLAVLVARLNSNNTLPLPVVDASGYTGMADLTFPEGISDLPGLQRQLRRQGLVLKQARRPVAVFVLRAAAGLPD